MQPLRWLCFVVLFTGSWAESACCGSGTCGEATKAGGYCFGQKSEASCHSHAVDDRPCTWITRKGKSKCVKGKDCSHLTGAKPAQAKKPPQSRAEPASKVEQPEPQASSSSSSSPPPDVSRREERIAERQAEREKRRAAAPTAASSPPPLAVAMSPPPPDVSPPPPPPLLSTSSNAAVAAPSTMVGSEADPSDPVAPAPSVPSPKPWAATRAQEALVGPTVRRPITPAELKERALVLGGQAWERTRAHSLAAYERAQARLHKLVRRPMPFGLPPLIEVEQYKALAMRPAVLTGLAGAAFFAFCCCCCCVCRAYNSHRKKHYRMYTPLTGDPFDDGERETFLVREEGRDEEAGASSPRKPRTVHF